MPSLNSQLHYVELIPAFENNYIFLITNKETNEAIVVDPGEATQVLRLLKERNLTLKAILITHHHHDHIGGVEKIQHSTKAEVYAPQINKAEIPTANTFISEKNVVDIIGLQFQVIELAGHTFGHVAFYNEKYNWLFSGDVLFGLGCGRLFEGTFQQLQISLNKLKSLPNDTLVFCAHEYTENNLKFCQTLVSVPEFSHLICAKNLMAYQADVVEKRKNHRPTVPLILGVEKSVNPFLIVDDLTNLTALRQLRNTF